MYGPSPMPPHAVIERIARVLEVRGVDAQIRDEGRGEARLWTRKMQSDDESAHVLEDPEPALPDDPTERAVVQAIWDGDRDAYAVYADWLEGRGQLQRAEFLRRADRRRAIARQLDAAWLSSVRMNTSLVLHFAAMTSSTSSSGTARFCSRVREHDAYREEMLRVFDAICIAIDTTHYITGIDLFDWKLFDAARFLDGPGENLHARHVAWRRDTFDADEIAVWGSFARGDIVERDELDRVQLY